jgi:hypothetical protein
MRWHVDDLATIDAWGQAQGLQRTEAIRRLVRLGLAKTRKQ